MSRGGSGFDAEAWDRQSERLLRDYEAGQPRNCDPPGGAGISSAGTRPLMDWPAAVGTGLH
jgi:hypothetical protein